MPTPACGDRPARAGSNQRGGRALASTARAWEGRSGGVLRPRVSDESRRAAARRGPMMLRRIPYVLAHLLVAFVVASAVVLSLVDVQAQTSPEPAPEPGTQPEAAPAPKPSLPEPA